jgi:hypothetical protein
MLLVLICLAMEGGCANHEAVGGGAWLFAISLWRKT